MFPRAREDKIDVGVDATDRLGSAGRCALGSVARVERLRNVRCDSRDSSLRTTAPRGVTSRRDFEHPEDAASGPGWRRLSMTNRGGDSRITPD